jgi:hypothetical protein
MILPAKHLRHDRALLGIGAELLAQLSEPRTISDLWERTRLARSAKAAPITFDWFILAVSFLYAISAIDYADGVVLAMAKQ